MTTALVTIASHDLDHVTGGRILPPDPGTGPFPVPAPWQGLGPKTNQPTGPTKGPAKPIQPLL